MKKYKLQLKIIVLVLNICIFSSCTSTVRFSDSKIQDEKTVTRTSKTNKEKIEPNKKIMSDNKDNTSRLPTKFTGYASYYHDKFDGRTTASGEVFNQKLYTAAHKELPFGTLVKVTRVSNGKSVQVRINDRGPFVENRIIDLSYAAALELDLINAGVAEVILEIIDK